MLVAYVVSVERSMAAKHSIDYSFLEGGRTREELLNFLSRSFIYSLFVYFRAPNALKTLLAASIEEAAKEGKF